MGWLLLVDNRFQILFDSHAIKEESKKTEIPGAGRTGVEVETPRTAKMLHVAHSGLQSYLQSMMTNNGLCFTSSLS